jgi:hypothetical protein
MRSIRAVTGPSMGRITDTAGRVDHEQPALCALHVEAGIGQTIGGLLALGARQRRALDELAAQRARELPKSRQHRERQ